MQHCTCALVAKVETGVYITLNYFRVFAKESYVTIVLNYSPF